jgi:uncharacterized protein (DUF2147 family)
LRGTKKFRKKQINFFNMNPITTLSSFLLIVGLVVASYGKSFAQDITGEWVNAAQDTKVLIYKGRKNTNTVRYDEDINKYYGRITWSKDGSAKKDEKIILAFSPQGGNYYKDGKIMHTRNGREYQGYLQLNADGTLKMRKYVEVSYVGTTEIWNRIGQ